VFLLRAADEAHRRHAVAVAVERLGGRLPQVGAVGETEIVCWRKKFSTFSPPTSISADCVEVITLSDL